MEEVPGVVPRLKAGKSPGVTIFPELLKMEARQQQQS